MVNKYACQSRSWKNKIFAKQGYADEEYYESFEYYDYTTETGEVPATVVSEDEVESKAYVRGPINF